MGDKRDNNCFGEECLRNQQEHIMSHMTEHRQDERPHHGLSGGATLTWVDCQESCESF